MIVLDASALVDVVLAQKNADWILGLLDEEDVAAPSHQPAEVLSALARLVRAGVLTPEKARIALDAALGTPQQLVTPSAAHVRRAFALREHIRVADGLYVALADELDCPLVTTDRRLAGANTPCEVRVPPSGPGPIPPPREG
ncbi:type II toxin-antitoxin system VapC family toxin [Pseudonocardia nigra]|uniref:type II toxin-antitoxin system VapC family toxin n=1 Tax=Pseudonocardia nigra TaxID=1921578 RepID=UPI001C5F86BF|nr:type II toxin-antitoxin system VapC family toxin [Pseudonocardia nigra]